MNARITRRKAVRVGTRTTAVAGYDMPPYTSMADYKIWKQVESLRGTA